ncbi:MAG: acyl carrier protein [Alphaproteobacteria bacterium]
MAKLTIDDFAKVIGESLNRDLGKVTPEMRLDDLGVSSLDLVEIIMVIEDKYDVEIGLDAIDASETINTVGDLIEVGRTVGLV